MTPMPRTYVRLFWREIRHSLNRFLAILAIVALGTGFLTGLIATTPDMRLTADRYYDNSHMMDLRIVSTGGLTDKDIEALKNTDGVEEVMPAFQKDAYARYGDSERKTARIHSLGDKDGSQQNRVTVYEGRLPEKAGECVLIANHLLPDGLAVGDTITVSLDDGDLSDTLSTDTLTVTGLAHSAYYCSVEKETTTLGNGTVDLFVYVTASTFCQSVYSEAFVTVAGARDMDSFSDAYFDAVEVVADRIKAQEDALGERRFAEIYAEAKEKIDDADAEYADAKQKAEKELADALKKLEDGERELADGKKQWQDGVSALETGRETLKTQKADTERQLADKEKELQAGKQAIAEGETALDAAEQQLADVPAQLEAARAQIEQMKAAGMDTAAAEQQLAEQEETYRQSVAALSARRTALETQKQTVTAGESALKAARAEAEKKFAEAQAQLDESERKLNAAEQEIRDNEKTLADGRGEYEKAKKEADEKLSDAEKELNDGKKKLDDLKRPEWYVLDRQTNVSYVSFSGNAEKVEAVAKVFPLFFFLVAALVALTTMTRMVEERRTQIGTLKALGYGKGAIAAQYLLYALLATVLGCALGLTVGMRLFPTVIWQAYTILYTIPSLVTPFRWNYALIAGAAAAVCTAGSTLAACAVTLAERPATLMRPRAPKAGHRILLEHIPPLWKRMSFTQKVTARNLLRYKKRFFMTTFGIAGCTALLVAGFGLKDAIGSIIPRQYGEIYHYDAIVSFSESNWRENDECLSVLNGENGAGWMAIHQESADLTAGDVTRSVTLFVPSDTEKLETFITFRSRTGGESYTLDDDTVLLTEKLCDKLGVKRGDTVTAVGADDKTVELTVGGIVENYVYDYVYLTPARYRALFGSEPEYLSAAVQGGVDDEAKRDAFSSALLQTGEVSRVQFIADLSKSFEDILSKINYIVYVLILSAGALAFIVLYNLTNINITEREKELATLRVLGFHPSETAMYIFRETAILTVIGTGVGLLLGTWLCRFVVLTAEVDIVMFGRDIYALSYLLAAALTVLFSVLVDFVMLRRLHKIDMVESMKAGE